MNTPSDGLRARRSVVVVVTILLGLVAAMVSSPARVEAADGDWSMQVGASADTVAAGGRVTFTMHVVPNTTAAALADIEVYDGAGSKAFQFFWDTQLFTAGRARVYSTTWNIPATTAPGTYTVTAGIFRSGWGQLFAWNNNAATITITAPGQPTTTAPTTTAAPTSTTTTTAPTTTAAPTSTTTTTAPTTTAAPTSTTTTTAPTTTAAPTTSAPPTGSMFVEDFATRDGFYSRFDFGWGGGDSIGVAQEVNGYEGDHSLACSGPDQRRTINLGRGVGNVTPSQVAAGTGKAQVFWWCAPGNDSSKGHVMTATNTLGYNIAYFSPKQVFTNVSRVCWDQNLTTMDAKWTNVVIAPMADVERETRETGYLDLSFDPPGFQDPSGPTTHVVAYGGVGVKVNFGNVSYWQGTSFVGGEDFFNGVQSTDKASRFRHCMIDDGNGTVRVTQQRPDGTTRTRNFAGAFPDGPVRVVFEDDIYDAPKRAGYRPDTLTWHWDNIEIG